jgi:histidinol-phosphatase
VNELDLALEMAGMADEISLRYFARNPEVSIKQDGSLVTIADRLIEERIRARIAEVFPGHGVLGEEEGLQGDHSAPVWVIDPIDGTNNYASGIPVFATLIALRVEGRTELGVVSAPALEETYDATRGGGARLNGKTIGVSNISTMSDATVCFGSYRRMIRHGYEEQVREILAVCRRDRGFGDFWGHMLVAKGALEAMVEPKLKLWDVAACEVIVEEAGGRLTNFRGEPFPDTDARPPLEDSGPQPRGAASCLSSNGVLHDQMIGLLAR